MSADAPKRRHRRSSAGSAPAPGTRPFAIIPPVRLLRMKPGHGEVLLAEGDVAVAAEEQMLLDEFRRQLDEGMWAAVPTTSAAGRREARMVKAFEDVPRDADRVIFFPRAAAGRRATDHATAMILALSATLIVIVALLREVA